jgi:hypothetical protein
VEGSICDGLDQDNKDGKTKKVNFSTDEIRKDVEVQVRLCCNSCNHEGSDILVADLSHKVLQRCRDVRVSARSEVEKEHPRRLNAVLTVIIASDDNKNCFIYSDVNPHKQSSKERDRLSN